MASSTSSNINTKGKAQFRVKQIWDFFSSLASSTYLDQSGSKTYVALTYDGANNRYTANLSPAITTYTIGLSITAYLTNANNAATEAKLNLNNLGDKVIRKAAGIALEAGDITAGAYTFIYNGTYFLIENTTLQLASDVETQAGTSATKAVTPLKLTNWWTNITSKAISFTAGVSFPFLSSLANRMLMVDASGFMIAGPDVYTGGFISDADIIAEITNNSNLFTAANNFEVTINPANGKVFYQGQWYNGGIYKYFAVGDNVVWRTTGA